MKREWKHGIRQGIFLSVAGGTLLVWLVTMGVLTAMTYQRVVSESEDKISLAQSAIEGEISSLIYGNQRARLDVNAERGTLAELMIYPLIQAAWPEGQRVAGGYGYSLNGDTLFSGMAALTYGDLSVRTGNYLRLYNAIDTSAYYLPLDGVFSPKDVETIVAEHGPRSFENWRKGETTGVLEGGLFWADELVFLHRDGSERRYTAVNAAEKTGERLRVTFDENSEFGGTYDFFIAGPVEAQELLARNLAALEQVEWADRNAIQGNGLFRREAWYRDEEPAYEGSEALTRSFYFTYFPVKMTLLELWETYLVTFLTALTLAILFSSRFSKRLGEPVNSLHRTARTDGNTEHYRIKSGIRELDDLGESLARLTHEEKEAKRKAQDDLKREQDLTRAVAHELKTPLAILRAHAEALSENIVPEKQAQYLHIIMDESDRMSSLVGELLDLSRMEAGAEKLSREEVDLEALTRRVFSRIEALAPVSLTLAPLTVSGDPALLERAISNYASNALRHCAPGGEIRVTLRAEGGVAHLTVENDGEAIPPEALPHLWDTFYKVDTARTRGNGTGLGLAIVRSVATLHGGSCAVENRKDGPAFRLSLPCNGPTTVV